MKGKSEYFPPFKDEGELIASWGDARLIKFLNGKWELRGGPENDLAEVKKWISLFLHEAVVGEDSGRRS